MLCIKNELGSSEVCTGYLYLWKSQITERTNVFLRCLTSRVPSLDSKFRCRSQDDLHCSAFLSKHSIYFCFCSTNSLILYSANTSGSHTQTWPGETEACNSTLLFFCPIEILTPCNSSIQLRAWTTCAARRGGNCYPCSKRWIWPVSDCRWDRINIFWTLPYAFKKVYIANKKQACNSWCFEFLYIATSISTQVE